MKTLLFLSLLSLSLAWMPPSLHHQTLPALFAVASGGDNRKDDETPRDFPPDEELVDSYKGEIDWDAEWKKVVQKQNAAADRPGKDFYKSEAQIAAIRAANKASRNIDNTVKDLPSLPSWRSLKGDWKVGQGNSIVVDSLS